MKNMKKVEVTKTRFGTAGFPPNFFLDKKNGGSNRDKIFSWLKSKNLDALELQCTYGIRMSEEQAIRYRKLAEENNIYLSMHAPYYVCLASQRDEVKERSKQEIIKAFKLAEILGVTRIIFHPGGGYGKSENARGNGIKSIINALNSIKSEINTSKIRVYPEIGGKVNTLGSLDEIIEICKKVSYARPCIDIAHLHAREIGSLTSEDSIIKVLKKIEKELGREILEETHFHMYPVDYTDKGEKVHKMFTEDYHPRAENFISAIKKMNLNPVVICEAHNTQDEGAMLMKGLYNN